MKKLILLILIAINCLFTVKASEFALHKAINEFVKIRDISVSQSLNKGIVSATKAEQLRQWQITNYTFTLKGQNADKCIDKLIKAYEKDMNDPNVYIAYQNSGDNVNYSIDYSSNEKPLKVGWSNEYGNSLVISGTEKQGTNTVIAVVWHKKDNNTDSTEYKGKIYIIDRDPVFQKIKDENETTDVPENENIRRLLFYSNKYSEQIQRWQTGANIIKATIFVVDDIIRNGSAIDKNQALICLDNMLSVIPNANSIWTKTQMRELNENAKILLNLIQRLSNNYNPEKYESTPNTFTIEGKIDEGLWDIGYYIYMSDDDMIINTNDSELIKADGQNFFLQKDLSDVKLGRLRALFKDGTVCSAWIDMLFVPGETAELTVHNGYYTLTGSGFYRQWSEAAANMHNGEEHMIKYARDHIDQPGALCLIFKEGRLNPSQLQEIYDLVPDDIKSSAYGVYLRKYLQK